MARRASAGVYRAPRPTPARPSLDLVPDLALRLFATLDAGPEGVVHRPGRAPRARRAEDEHTESTSPAL